MARGGAQSPSLDEEPELLQQLLAHLDIAELRLLRKPEFLTKAVQYGSIEVRPLVQQIEQLLCCRRVLVIGGQAARRLDRDE